MHLAIDPDLLDFHMSPISETADWLSIFPPNEAFDEQTVTKHNNDLQSRSSLIRTGCIPCLHEGLKCDGTNLRCRRPAITQDWRINSGPSGARPGTWRERRGIYVFVSFARSPERAGLFESPFWHRTVISACFHNEAVAHVASAIGALQEYILRPTDDRGIAFALQQCNRSINLLTASSEEKGNGADADPAVALITCVLFTLFEALMGHPAQAITHSLQSRKLLEDCERHVAAGQKSLFLDTNSVLPIIYGLERQAKAVQGKDARETDVSQDPGLPDVSQIHNLQHANWTLYFTWIMVYIFCQDAMLAMPPFELAARLTKKREIFLPWLKTWEQSFSEFLFNESANLSMEDMQRARLLKANHIATTILAKGPLGRVGGWPGFNDACKAIIDLSASVLNTYAQSPSSGLPTFHFPFLAFGLWISEPCFIVMARCNDPELQKQAAGLLHGQTYLKRQREVGRQARTQMLSDEPLGEPTDTDRWTTDDWLKFAGNVRLDTAMATYFGRLPSEYIDKPVYPPSERIE